MSTAVVVYKTGYTERYSDVDHFRVSREELTLFVDHEPITIDLTLVDTFDVHPESAHAV